MNFCKHAARAKKNGDTVISYLLYKHLTASNPEFKKFVEANIALLEKLISNTNNTPICHKKIIGMSTVKNRASSLNETLKSLDGQADEIHIYPDGFEYQPPTNFTTTNIIIHNNFKKERLRDLGKFIALQKIDNNSYFFSVDDDIIYPDNYISKLIKSIEFYKRKAIIGVHGSIMSAHSIKYFDDREKIIHYKHENKEDILVNILGTGTIGLHSSILSKSQFLPRHPGMADIDLAIFAKTNNIPMIAIKKERSWIKDTSQTHEETLYKEFLGNDKKQSQLIQKNNPWGNQSIINTLINNISP